MNKYLIKLLILLLTTNLCKAQTFRGIVEDANNGEILEKVLIKELESGKSVVSGADGYFEFSGIPNSASFRFSLLGYEEKLFVYTGTDKIIRIALYPKIDQLAEVLLRSSNVPQEIRQTPAAVSLISENDLKRTDNFNLQQSFNFVPGIFVGQGALNTNKINIRGIGSRAQFGTNRIKAYINGIPLSTAEGELSLDDLDSEYLERIEIYKGPVSSIFGAGLGGAINLYTRQKTRDQKSVVSDFSYGSFNTRKTRANLTYVKDSLDLSINYNQLESDGFRENAGYDRISLLGTAGYLNRSGNYWSFFVLYSNLKAFIPSSLNRQDFINNPESAAFTWYRAAGYESYDKNVIGASYEHNFSEKLKSQTSIFFNAKDAYEPRPFNILDEKSSSIGLRTRFNYKNQIFQKPAEISFGLETMLEWYETGTFENLYEESEVRKSIKGEALSRNDQNRNYANIFSQVNLDLTSKFSVEAGLSLNFTSYDLEDRFSDDDVDQSGNYGFDPVISPRLGLSYEAFPAKNFYASVSHGFSTPTVAETLTPDGLINTDLKMETGINYEAGFKGSWLNKRLYTELNLYSIQIRNLLVARRVGQDQYVGVNAGKANHNGIEFTSVYNTTVSNSLELGLFLNSTLSFFEFDKFVDLGENYSGNELPGVPRYMISPGVRLSFDQFTTNLTYQAFGKMALNDPNSEYTEPYQLLNLKLNYTRTLLPGLSLRLNFGINNLLDEHYAASIVTNAVGFGGTTPRYYYPGNPRNFFGGAGLKFQL